VVPEGFSGIIQRFSKFYKLIGPGLHYLNPEIDSLTLVDKRERVIALPKQKVITKDNVSLTIDAALFYNIQESKKSVFSIQNLRLSIVDLATTGLRNIVGSMTLQSVLQHREYIAEGIQANLSEPSSSWGCSITRVLIQDILLPEDIRKMMGNPAMAKKIAAGNIIAAQANVQSAKFMREAAEVLNTDAAMQIRYLETLEDLSRGPNAKLVFWPATYSNVGLDENVLEEGARLLHNN